MNWAVQELSKHDQPSHHYHAHQSWCVKLCMKVLYAHTHHSLPIHLIKFPIFIQICIHQCASTMHNQHFLSKLHCGKACHSCLVMLNFWLKSPQLPFHQMTALASRLNPSALTSLSTLQTIFCTVSGALDRSLSSPDATSTELTPHVLESSLQTADHMVPTAVQRLCQPLTFHTAQVQ